MWCMKCNKDIADCICPDIEERLAACNAHPNIDLPICPKCGEHLARCACKKAEA